MAQLSPAGIALILKHEGFSATPEWPGAKSGVTIGHGYDLGYVSVDEFAAHWGARFPPAQFALLSSCVGVTGPKAKNRIPALAAIAVKRADGAAVFQQVSLPKAEFKTRAVYPRADALCDNAYSALVSLVFNRGQSLTDPAGDPPELQRRREMREIRDTLASTTVSPDDKLRAIAASLRSMKRIWVGQGVAGLLKRRDDEAKLVETCL